MIPRGKVEDLKVLHLLPFPIVFVLAVLILCLTSKK